MPTYRHTGRKAERVAPTHSVGSQRTAAMGAPAKAPVLYIVLAVLLAAIVLALGIAFAMGSQEASEPATGADGAGGAGGTAFTEDLPDETIAVAEDVVMTMAGSQDTYVLVGEEYLEAGCQATDPEEGDITGTVSIDSNVDTRLPGDYRVTYTATDGDGAIAQATRNVHVVQSFEESAQNVPVLMYHYVYDEADPPADLNGNHISNAKLAQECKYLSDNGYYYPSFEELRAWVDGKHTLPAKSVILTFDDGEMGFLQHGIPVLEQYQVPATSFVVAKDAARNVIDYASPYVQFESHSFDMHRAGGGNVGQGGVIHALTQQEIYEDALAVNGVLGGDGAVAMAYPFGDNNEAAWAALDDAGVLCAFTVKNDRISPGDNPLALNRVRISGEYGLDSFVALVQPNA